MQVILILLRQLLIMAIFILIGIVLFRKNKITKEGSKSIANLLIYIVLPCVILNGFQTKRTPQLVRLFILSCVLSLLLLLLSIAAARLVFKKSPIDHFAAAFANPGFFGVPLITALFDSSAVFYIAPFIALLNIFQWTYGKSVLSGEHKKISFCEIFLSPFFIAFFAGLVLFLADIQLPALFGTAVKTLTNLNTPLAMIITGVYFAQTDLVSTLTRKSLYQVSFIRLVLQPSLALAVLLLLPIANADLKLCLLLVAGCPVGSNVAVYAQLMQKDYPYAVQTVVLSTVLSVITIPLFCAAGLALF